MVPSGSASAVEEPGFVSPAPRSRPLRTARLRWSSAAAGAPSRRSMDNLRELTRDWEMLSYQVDEFVATSDRVEVTVNARVYLGSEGHRRARGTHLRPWR